jgi:hypothetical protein
MSDTSFAKLENNGHKISISSDGDVEISAETLKFNGEEVVTGAVEGGGTPGGSDTQIQFNDGGEFGGIAGGTAGQVLTSNGASAPSFQNNILLSKTVTLTDAQIKALPSTPVEIVPAPGAGKALIPFQIVLRMSIATAYANIGDKAGIADTLFAFTPLANGSGDWVTASLGGTNKVAYALLAPYLYDGAEGIVAPARPNASTDVVANQPIALQCSNFNGEEYTDLGNFTGGHASNTLKVTVFYTIIDV